MRNQRLNGTYFEVLNTYWNKIEEILDTVNLDLYTFFYVNQKILCCFRTTSFFPFFFFCS